MHLQGLLAKGLKSHLELKELASCLLTPPVYTRPRLKEESISRAERALGPLRRQSRDGPSLLGAGCKRSERLRTPWGGTGSV